MKVKAIILSSYAKSDRDNFYLFRCTVKYTAAEFTQRNLAENLLAAAARKDAIAASTLSSCSVL